MGSPNDIADMMAKLHAASTVVDEEMLSNVQECSDDYFLLPWRKTLLLQANCPTVSKWLACSPPTKGIRVQSPAGTLRIFACGNRAGRCRWSAGFLGDLPFPPPLHSSAAPCSHHPPLIGTQDLTEPSKSLKSRPNLFIHSLAPTGRDPKTNVRGNATVGRKQEYSEKNYRKIATSATFPTSVNPSNTPPGTKPGVNVVGVRPRQQRRLMLLSSVTPHDMLLCMNPSCRGHVARCHAIVAKPSCTAYVPFRVDEASLTAYLHSRRPKASRATPDSANWATPLVPYGLTVVSQLARCICRDGWTDRWYQGSITWRGVGPLSTQAVGAHGLYFNEEVQRHRKECGQRPPELGIGHVTPRWSRGQLLGCSDETMEIIR
ncbi:hypothetical protein PR048_023145 [Dryococelus australis]|uniref:Uncharacterized protein n=1 Tax=Dryococelus australis TaxID=614101 RepID=A0ABQ9GTB5_9NEOP|nr:hypothetical protein PR048_023145 [Dryococelus australis]